MSLSRQFFLSVLLALTLGLSVLGVAAVWHVRASVENEMRLALESGDQMVGNALLSLPQQDADAYLARLVKSFDGNRHVHVALIERERVQAQSRLATAHAAPGWYRRLLEIPPETRRKTAPGLAGRALRIDTDARNEIGEAWVQFRDGAAILGLFSLMMLGLLHLAMARIAAPLRRLSSGFEAVGSGDYAARVSAQGPREISALASAFNRMTDRLRGLEEANRRLTGQMLAIQEEERADLARDLHDEMGPFLFAMRVDAQAIQAEAQKTGQAALAERAGVLGEAVGHIQSLVRGILKQLRPDGLAEIGLVTAIGNLVTFWQRHHGGTRVHLDIAAAQNGFGEERDGVIYRLVQEGLTNAVRHGGARHVWIGITAKDGAIRIHVEDDGVGFSAGEGGMGLKGMRERLSALSGSLVLDARAGGGTRLTASIPRVQKMEFTA